MSEYPGVSGTLFELHIAPLEGPDPSLRVPDAEAGGGTGGTELTALLERLEELHEEFVRFLTEEVVPNIDTSPHRVGVIERVTLLRGNYDTTSSDYLLFLDGILAGDGGVLERLGTRFSVRSRSRGVFREVGSWKTPGYPIGRDQSVSQSSDFKITPVDEDALSVELKGEAFRITRAKGSVTVEALNHGESIEELKSTVTEDGRSIFLRDRTGTTATYTSATSDVGLQTTIEVGDRTLRVDAPLDTYPYQLSEVLKDVALPQPYRVLRFAEAVKADEDFRTGLGGFTGEALVTFAAANVGCGIACDIAENPLDWVVSGGASLFAAGYCSACVVHGAE